MKRAAVALAEGMVQDLRYGARMLRRNPGFTDVVVITLMLGIGANTTIFTLIDAVLLKTVPVKDPKQLVLLQWVAPTGTPAGSHWVNGDTWQEEGRNVGTLFSYVTFQQLREHNQAFSDVFAFTGLGDHIRGTNSKHPTCAAHFTASHNKRGYGVQVTVMAHACMTLEYYNRTGSFSSHSNMGDGVIQVKKRKRWKIPRLGLLRPTWNRF